MNDEQIGHHLKRLRGQISPKTFARMFSISRAHYVNIEAGRKALQDDMVDVLVKEFSDLPLLGENDLACILRLKDYPIKKMIAWSARRIIKHPQDNEKINPDSIIELTEEALLSSILKRMRTDTTGACNAKVKSDLEVPITEEA